MSTVVGTVDYGTAIRMTRIRPVPGSGEMAWTRTAPHERHPFSDVSLPLTDQRGSGPRFRTGLGDEFTRTYRLPSDRSLAATALFGESSRMDWNSVYRQWGSLLADLHSVSSDIDHTVPEPPARQRLRRWWSASDLGDDRRSAARERFLDGVSAGTRDYLDDVLAEDLRGYGVLVHGWAGIGHSVLDEDGHVVAMVGEDVGYAPAEYDLGALTAQSVELAVFSPAGTAPSPAAMRTALLDAYTEDSGSTPDRSVLAAHTIEHIVRHVADFVWFADFLDGELPRWSALVNWLDEKRQDR